MYTQFWLAQNLQYADPSDRNYCASLCVCMCACACGVCVGVCVVCVCVCVGCVCVGVCVCVCVVCVCVCVCGVCVCVGCVCGCVCVCLCICNIYNYSIIQLHSHLSILKTSIKLTRNSSSFYFENQDKILCCLFVRWERLKCLVLQQVYFIWNITDSFNSLHSHFQGNRLYCHYEHYDQKMLQFPRHWFHILEAHIRKLFVDAFVVVRKWILFR